MSHRTPSAAAYICSLSDDELLAILVFLPGATFGACARVCSRWKSTVDNEDHWKGLLRCEYGMGETVVHINDLVSKAVCDWKALYRVCHMSLFCSAPGRVAARRAYFDAVGSPAIRALETTVIRAPVLRHSFSPVPNDAYADLLPSTVEFCSDDGISEYSFSYPIMNAFLFGHLTRGREKHMRNGGSADLPPRETHLLVNGFDSIYLLSSATYPQARYITPSSWCTSRGANENVSILLKLDRPCLVTGVMLCNPATGFDNHVRDALVFVGATKEEVAPKADRFTSFYRRPSGFIDAGPCHGPEASILFRLRQPWMVATDRTHTGKEPYALVEFSQGIQPGTQCFVYGPPTLARYVRVQLLSQFNPKNFPFEDINIDVNAICVLGTELVDSPHI